VINSLPKQLLLLACAFFLTRAWPLAIAEPWSYWEVFEAKKLDYYGWFERRGALLDIHYLAGIVPRPELHNYPNHPAPIHWLNMLLSRALGGWGVVALGTAIGLAGCIATFFALSLHYRATVAMVGALLFTMAPSSIIYDVDPNQGALAAVFWPFAALALGNSLPIRCRAWLLGVACLLSGQVSWMVWVVFGALLVGVLGMSWNGRFQTMPVRPLFFALCLGGSLTVLLFVLQVLLYTPDWQELRRYLGKQSAEYVGFHAWLIRTATRSAMSVGPALLIGALAGAVHIISRRRANSLELVAIAFLPLFIASSFVLRGFFKSENWPYEYLIFPASVLCCTSLASIPSGRSWRASIAALFLMAFTGLFYVFLRFSNPSLSTETLFIADIMANEAQPHEIVATNLVDQASPLQSWNVSGLGVAMFKANRLLRSGISTPEQLASLLSQFHTKSLDVVYIHTSQQSLHPNLRAILDLASCRNFTIPTHEGPLSLSLLLRNHYWKLTARHQAPESAPPRRRESDRSLQLCRLRISTTGDGSVTIQPRRFDKCGADEGSYN